MILIINKLRLLNLLFFFLLSLLTFFKLKIYYLKVESYLKHQKFFNFLEKFNIYWYNYEKNNTDLINILYLKSQKYGKSISKEIVINLKNKKTNYIKEFYQKDIYFQKTFEKNLYPLIEENLEILEVARSLKKKFFKKFLFVYTDNNFIFNFINKNYNYYNLDILPNIEIINFIIIFLKKKINNFFFKRIKKQKLKNEHFKRNHEVAFFPNKGVIYKDLYLKDQYYSKKINNKFYHKNLLHVEFNNQNFDKENFYYYKNKKINNVFLSEILNSKKIIKIFLEKNLKYFLFLLKIFLYDFRLFVLIEISLFKILKYNEFLNINKNLKLILIGQEYNFPREMLVASKLNEVRTLAVQDRVVLSRINSGMLFDYYLIPSPIAKNIYLKNKIINKNITKLIKTDFIKIKDYKISKRSNLIKKNCLVVDYHSTNDWYENGRSIVNSWRINCIIYNYTIELAKKYKKINFYIKSKNYSWLKIIKFKKIISEMRKYRNIKILSNTKKWSPEKSISICDFGIGYHSSLLDEMIYFKKPVVIFSPNKFPHKTFPFNKSIITFKKKDFFNKIDSIISDYKLEVKKIKNQKDLIFYKNIKFNLNNFLLKVLNNYV